MNKMHHANYVLHDIHVGVLANRTSFSPTNFYSNSKKASIRFTLLIHFMHSNVEWILPASAKVDRKQFIQLCYLVHGRNKTDRLHNITHYYVSLMHDNMVKQTRDEQLINLIFIHFHSISFGIK